MSNSEEPTTEQERGSWRTILVWVGVAWIAYLLLSGNADFGSGGLSKSQKDAATRQAAWLVERENQLMSQGLCAEAAEKQAEHDLQVIRRAQKGAAQK